MAYKFGADKISHWDYRFLELAHFISSWSKDESTEVGCIITTPDRRIISTGYNGLPRQTNDSVVEHPERHDRELDKYAWWEHAERNALYNAANLGASTKYASAYITLAPCADCARGLAQSGISYVFWDEFATEEYRQKGRLDTTISEDIFREAGVTTHALRLYHPVPESKIQKEES